MTEPTTAKRKERRDVVEHRARILAAARQLFETQGVDATTMMEIAQTAGVGQGTLYRRFAHKGQLCVALLWDNLQALQSTVETELAAEPHVPALDHLALLFRHLVTFSEENSQLLAGMGDAASGQRRTDFFRAPLYQWLHATIQRVLDQAVRQGEAAPLDTSLTAHLLFALFDADIYFYERRELGYTLEQILETLKRVVIEGIRAR